MYLSSSTASQPSGWQNPGFNASSWTNAVYVGGTFNPYNISVPYSSYSSTGTSNGSDQLLALSTFNVPAGVFSAILNISVKGNLNLWLNGVPLTGVTNPFSIELVGSAIPGNNVLAIQVTGNGSSSIRYAYQLTIQSCQNYTSPILDIRRPTLSGGNSNTSGAVQETLTPTPSPTPKMENNSVVQALPNISKDGEPIVFKVYLKQASEVTLSLYNVLGEKVFVVSQSGRNGLNSIVWNLQNQMGNQVASGLYLYRVGIQGSNDGTQRMGKVVVLH